MEKSNKKKYYYHNNNKNKNYYPKKKKKLEEPVEEKKITYEELINIDSDLSEIIDYPKETKENMMKFVAVSIVIMAIVFSSLLLFRLI